MTALTASFTRRRAAGTGTARAGALVAVQLAARVPWLFVGAASCFTAAGFLASPLAGCLVAGVALLALEWRCSGDA